MSKHAFLSASSSHRWLECPPSAKLCSGVADEVSDYALQGTDAHTLCEYKVKKYLGEKVRNPSKKLKFFNQEMDDCSDAYVSFIAEKVEKAKDDGLNPLVMVEQKLDFSRFVNRGFGTGDCVIIAGKTLHIIDFKYGKGVEISAENNPQMMCYALGAAEMFGVLYDIETVNMTIFQPRIANVSEWSLSIEELYSWAEGVLKPAAELAYNGEGEFKAGSHCRFCKIKANCRKRMEYNMENAKYDFSMPDTLKDEEISILLGKLDELVSWANDVKEYALKQALSGKKYEGFKVVAGRSSRKYVDDMKVAEAVKAAGYNPYEQKLLGVTAMTSLMGRQKFDEVLGELVTKPAGKPTLVPLSDRREPMNMAIDDFKEDK